ncbi:MAG: alpha/beta fold hydrolase [Actinomycetota bacterium]
MNGSGRIPVVLVPGAVMPAGLAYTDLVDALGPEVEARYKDLEVYAADAPPPAYGLGTEVQGIRRFARDAGFEEFHLVGYSAGGAASVAYCATHPEDLLSLTLLEPAWAGREGRSELELEQAAEFDRIMTLPPHEMMPAFVRAQLKEGVEPPPPPPGPPPPWMAQRPAGLDAIVRSFETFPLDNKRLRAFERPVLFVLGGKSHPAQYLEIATRLETLFPDFTLEVFEERHHFDPPHRVEPEALAPMLRALWDRASV